MIGMQIVTFKFERMLILNCRGYIFLRLLNQFLIGRQQIEKLTNINHCLFVLIPMATNGFVSLAVCSKDCCSYYVITRNIFDAKIFHTILEHKSLFPPLGIRFTFNKNYFNKNAKISTTRYIKNFIDISFHMSICPFPKLKTAY